MRPALALACALALAACEADATPSDATGDASPDVGADSAAEPDVVADIAEDVAPACPIATAIVASGEPIPGRTLTLEVDPSGVATVAWTASLGVVTATGPARASWLVPADAARHVAVSADLGATLGAPGCAAVTLAKTVTIDWPDALRTVVISNPSVAGSSDVAARYAAFRELPDDHVCAVAADDATTLAGSDYPRWLGEVMACVARVGPHVHYLVPVWGVPYKVTDRIADIANPSVKVTTSLDALLVYGAPSVDFASPSFNAYYQPGSSRLGDWSPYVPFGELRDKDLRDYFLVARIDGADAEAAMALVDRTALAEARAAAGTLSGTVYVDGNRGLPHPATDAIGSYEAGEWNIIGVETVFAADGRYPIVADYQPEEFGTAPAPLTAPDALYYAGWYAFGHYNDAFTWAVGAIGGHLDSCSACDLRGEVDWAAMALRRGITATFGAVNEPYVAGMPEYDQVFAYLLQGASFGEAGYEATRRGAWMMVWIGDPLYRPYRAAGP
ncbi:MAG: TIGR03790 family protein [Myxococcota bacterium]